MSPYQLHCELYLCQEKVERLRQEPTATHHDVNNTKADLMFFENAYREATGFSVYYSDVPPAVATALRTFFEETCGYGWVRRQGWVGRGRTRTARAVPVCAIDPQAWDGVLMNTTGVAHFLQALELTSNNLDGVLPDALGDLGACVECIRLEFNELYGPIPSSIGKLVGLMELNLSSNQLSGSVPTNIGSLRALKRLNLASNELSGELPLELGTLEALEVLDLSGNFTLTGVVPGEFGGMKSLVELNLAENAILGPLPDSLSRLGQLSRLEISNNRIGGVIPRRASTTSRAPSPGSARSGTSV